MDTQSISILLGAIVPIVLALIKRFVALDLKASYAVTFLICFGVACGIRLYENGWDWRLLFSDFASVLAVSQLVYGGVIKNLGLDKVIEGK